MPRIFLSEGVGCPHDTRVREHKNGTRLASHLGSGPAPRVVLVRICDSRTNTIHLIFGEIYRKSIALHWNKTNMVKCASSYSRFILNDNKPYRRLILQNSGKYARFSTFWRQTTVFVLALSTLYKGPSVTAELSRYQTREQATVSFFHQLTLQL